jgi:outer membrane protein OmpA-like peptidoglycan-associated protein
VTRQNRTRVGFADFLRLEPLATSARVHRYSSRFEPRPQLKMNSASSMPSVVNLTEDNNWLENYRVRICLRQGGSTVRISSLSDAVRIGVRALAGAGLLLTATGCLATRSWVGDQLRPITGQQEQLQAQMNNLHLERKLVLDSSQGPTFASGSAALSGNAKREIDQFVGDLQGSTPPGSATSERVFVVAGYTDALGHEDYNYELGQRRATSVAGYLVGKKGLDPTQVRVISYGASKPVDENNTRSGRRKNRRVEILVYQEKISTGS